MGILDELRRMMMSPELRSMRITNPIPKEYIPESVLSDLEQAEEVVVCVRDPSKAIEATHWDGLTPEAQEALSKQGFYREGDDVAKQSVKH